MTYQSNRFPCQEIQHMSCHSSAPCYSFSQCFLKTTWHLSIIVFCKNLVKQSPEQKVMLRLLIPSSLLMSLLSINIISGKCHSEAVWFYHQIILYLWMSCMHGICLWSIALFPCIVRIFIALITCNFKLESWIWHHS